jgi:outer membrane protein TolC
MKDSDVLKKLSILFSLFIVANTALWADEESDLQNYLTDEKNLIFDFQQQQSNAQTDKLHNSWISPINVSYQKDWKPKADGKMHASEAFSIGIDQPIFKSGGIYFGIKYANALKGANQKEIELQKRQLIAQAIEILFNYKKTKLQIKKLKLLVANGAIAMKRQEEMFGAGLIDSSLLDQTILAHNRDNTQLIDLQLVMRQLRASFAFLSDKNPAKLRLPRLRLISLSKYKKSNLKLAANKLRAEEKRYSSKMIWTKYLPTVTAYAHYKYTDENTPNTMKGYKNYGFRVTMPISINAPNDIEAGRLDYLLAMTKVRDQRKIIKAEYDLVRASLHMLDRKIALAKKDESLYSRLLKNTKGLAKAGEKTKYDTKTMSNSQAMKRLDRRIYYIDKQLQLLKLYAKIGR